MLECQGSPYQTGQTGRAFGMPNDSLDGADVERLIAIIRRVESF